MRWCWLKLTIFLVDSSMAFQSEPISECCCTNLTFEWLFAAVHFSMILQMGRLAESWSACIASKDKQNKNDNQYQYIHTNILFCVFWRQFSSNYTYLYGFSPVWMRRWFHSVAWRANPLSHTSHTYGFSPLCVLSWFFKCGDCENCIPHVWHLKQGKNKKINYYTFASTKCSANGKYYKYSLIWLFSGMDAWMILQIDGLSKCQATNIALVILFAAVQFLVRP